MEKEWLYALLAVILILVLLFIPAKIRDIYNVFKGSGEEESFALTKLRADCTKLVDNEESIERCALDVAEETLKAKEDSIIAERWLRIQIRQGSSIHLRDSLDFGKNKLYPASKDWAGAVETYNLMYEKWNGEEVQLAIDDAQANLDVSNVFKVYDSIKLGSGDYNFNWNLLVQNSNLLETNLKDAVRLYQKNMGKISDIPLLKSGETCNTKYGATKLWLPACIYLSRVSLSTGCYLDAREPTDIAVAPSGMCKSCNEYPKIESSSTITEKPILNTETGTGTLKSSNDVCSGYYNQKTCDADPCNKGYCVWVSGRCVEKFSPTVVAGNYWDLG